MLIQCHRSALNSWFDLFLLFILNHFSFSYPAISAAFLSFWLQVIGWRSTPVTLSQCLRRWWLFSFLLDLALPFSKSFIVWILDFWLGLTWLCANCQEDLCLDFWSGVGLSVLVEITPQGMDLVQLEQFTQYLNVKFLMHLEVCTWNKLRGKKQPRYCNNQLYHRSALLRVQLSGHLLRTQWDQQRHKMTSVKHISMVVASVKPRKMILK